MIAEWLARTISFQNSSSAHSLTFSCADVSAFVPSRTVDFLPHCIPPTDPRRQNWPLPLILVLVVAESMAGVWYAMSYIPFGRKMVISGCQVGTSGERGGWGSASTPLTTPSNLYVEIRPYKGIWGELDFEPTHPKHYMNLSIHGILSFPCQTTQSAASARAARHTALLSTR